jgi:hypothetical protein
MAGVVRDILVVKIDNVIAATMKESAPFGYVVVV